MSYGKANFRHRSGGYVVLSVTLFAATLACLVVPPLNVWAGPLLVVLFITNPPVFWSALGLSGLGGLAYFLRRNRP